MTMTSTFLFGVFCGTLFGVIVGMFLVWVLEKKETVKLYAPPTPEEAEEILAKYREFHSDIKKWVEEFEDE